MARNWTWINDEAPEDFERLEPTLNALAIEWSEAHDQLERDQWRRQDRYEEGYDYEFETEEEAREFEAQERQHATNLRMRMQVVEELLARHGARMMRPYEHWNEDEAYVQYMENRADY